MTNSLKFFSVFFVMFLIVHSCRKDESLPNAEISILSPTPLTEFNIYDTILVNALVKSGADTKFTLLVQLLNDNYIPVQPNYVFDGLSTNVEFFIQYPISDSTLAGGIHNLKLQVFENIETTQIYRQIYINEIPQMLKSICIVGAKDDQVGIKVIDENFQITKEFNVESDYSGSAVSSANGQFYIAGSTSGNLSAYNVNDFAPVWFIPGVPNPIQPYFTIVKTFADVCYAGFWNGQVIGFNKFGGVSYAAELNENTVPVDVFVHDVFLIKSSFLRSNESQNLIETYFVQSGVNISAQNVAFEPVGFSAPEFRRILIFANSSGQAAAFILDPTSGLINQPYESFTFPEGKVISIAAINQTSTLLALENGIFVYEYENSLTKISDRQNISALTFNHLNQTVFACTENEVILMNLQGDEVFQFDAGMPVLNIHLIFNK
jgi:hypothetical protein